MDLYKELAGICVKWNFSKKERSQRYIEDYKKKIIKQLKDSKNYLSYDVTNGRVEKFIFAIFSDTPFELYRIQLLCFYFSDQKLTKKNIKDELSRVRDFFKPKKLKIVVGCPASKTKLIRILKKLDFTPNGSKLIGKVNKSYVSIKKLSIPELNEFSYEQMNYKGDIQDVMNLEYRAHRNETTSVVYRMPKKHWAFFEDYLKEICKKKLAYVLRHKKKIIGFISYDINNDLIDGAFIVSISIDPKYKSLGISKYLYKKMLDDLKNKNIKVFYGYSKTKQVLKFSRKIAREPAYHSFALARDKLSTL